MIILFIDTRDNKNISAKLDIDGRIFNAASTNENKRPESVLNLIDEVCKKGETTIQNVDEIYVEEGPGSYTGLKVGASVANALSFALQKKVNGKFGEIIEPKYE